MVVIFLFARRFWRYAVCRCWSQIFIDEFPALRHGEIMVVRIFCVLGCKSTIFVGTLMYKKLLRAGPAIRVVFNYWLSSEFGVFECFMRVLHIVRYDMVEWSKNSNYQKMSWATPIYQNSRVSLYLSLSACSRQVTRGRKKERGRCKYRHTIILPTCKYTQIPPRTDCHR
jgi:hypothetical protein